jgi:hypothetical protein
LTANIMILLKGTDILIYRETYNSRKKKRDVV